MLISELQIINFRNIAFLRAAFAPGLNLIHGPNAQGKTNVLEAISLLVTGRSFRTTMDREMIPWVRDTYEATLVRARVEKRSGEERFMLTFNQSEKHVTINGNPIGRLGELVGRINAVLFTPSDLQIVRGGPAFRRRFLDVELSQISRRYLFCLQRYDLALRQRNALLKMHQSRPNLRQELFPWDAQLAEHGAELIHARQRMVAQLSQLSASAYNRISGGSEGMKITYQSQTQPGDDDDIGTIRAKLEQALAKTQAEDIRRGATSAGPHRDDFTFLLSGRDARDYGSQGQQRSCVLAMRLAELKIMEDATGECPLLLLDDLMSELDESRKRAFMECLDRRIQIFLTATERELVVSHVKPDMIFHMDDGTLREDLIAS
ncbi:MAG: DNA replication/repair protein RecF [Candidatus Sumerlaeota bacterium]|nr:DNA replication/repair protein RecF [Candidatus Sumerlaeota bacterium]